MNHNLGAHRLRPLDRLRQRIGPIVAVRDDADLHATMLAQRTMFPEETPSSGTEPELQSVLRAPNAAAILDSPQRGGANGEERSQGFFSSHGGADRRRHSRKCGSD